MYKNYKAKCKAITPIHVGGGEDFNFDPISYTVKEGYFYKINFENFFNSNSVFSKDFVKSAEVGDNPIELRKLVEKHFNPQERSTWDFKVEASPSFKRAFSNNKDNVDNRLFVQCMLHQGNHAVIPGSAIKGAMRTALLDALLDKNEKKNNRLISYVNAQRNAEIDPRKKNEIEGMILDFIDANGDFNDNHNRKGIREKDPFRHLKITDVLLPEGATQIVQVSNWCERGIKKEWQKNQFQIWVEVIKEEVAFDFILSLLDQPKDGGKYLSPITVKDINCDCYNFFEMNYRNEHSQFYEKQQSIDLFNYSKKLTDYFEKLDTSKSLLRIGRFCHFESITFRKEFRQFNSRKKTKGWNPSSENSRYISETGEKANNQKEELDAGVSRNLIDGEKPLGFMEFKLIAKPSPF